METTEVRERYCGRQVCLLLAQKGIRLKSNRALRGFSNDSYVPGPTQQMVIDALYERGVHIYTTVFNDDEMGDLFMAHCSLKIKTTNEWAPVNTVFPACSSRHACVDGAIIFALKNLI